MIIVESDAPEEQEIVDYLFEPDEEIEREGLQWKYYPTQDKAEEITNTIQNEIYNSIQETVEVEENTNTDIDVTEYYGEDNPIRRQEVTNNYSEFNYEKISKINSDDREDQIEFLNSSYMTVLMNRPYSITGPGGENTDEVEYVPATYSEQDLILAQRENFDMSLDIKVTGFRVTLPNGQIYNQMSTDEFCDADLQAGQKIEVKDLVDPLYVQSIDQGLMYGARLDIEYTMVLRNESAIPATKVEICNYLKDLSTDSDIQLSYDENTRMITDRYTNKDYGWKIYEKNTSSNVLEKFFTSLVRQDMRDDYYITCEYGSDIKALRDNPIGTAGERYIKVVLTKTLSSKYDGAEFAVSGEIIEYSNDLATRMRKKYPVATLEYKDQIPGNGEESLEVTHLEGYDGYGLAETDYATSNSIFIIPPTGESKNYMIYTTITIGLVAVLTISIIKKRRKKIK